METQNLNTVNLIKLVALTLSLFVCSANAQSAQSQTVDELINIKAELASMKSQYEKRIHDLERRLATAEQQLATQSTTAQKASNPAPEAAARESNNSSYASASNRYNPAIGIIIDGEIWAYDNPDAGNIPGFTLGGESGLADEGLGIGESEFVFSGNVDNWFYGQITAAIEQEDGEFGIGLEEAFIETLSLPASMTLRMGRFYSAVGYLNDKHKHAWDFADQALPYRAFMGSQYTDDGIQLRWLAPTDFFLELGAEIFRGGSYPAGGNANSGFGTRSLFAQTGGDIGFSHSWTAGFSWLTADAIERESGDENQPLLFDGNSDLYIADFVWKWAPNGNSKQRNITFQSEYIWRQEDGNVVLPATNQALSLKQNAQGWYVQGSYQWMPRWRAGLRIAGLSTDRPSSIFSGSALDPLSHNPRIYSFMLDYANSEFSRLRLQYNHDETSLVNNQQIGLQYIMSIGAHGGHEF